MPISIKLSCSVVSYVWSENGTSTLPAYPKCWVGYWPKSRRPLLNLNTGTVRWVMLKMLMEGLVTFLLWRRVRSPPISRKVPNREQNSLLPLLPVSSPRISSYLLIYKTVDRINPELCLRLRQYDILGQIPGKGVVIQRIRSIRFFSWFCAIILSQVRSFISCEEPLYF